MYSLVGCIDNISGGRAKAKAKAITATARGSGSGRDVSNFEGASTADAGTAPPHQGTKASRSGTAVATALHSLKREEAKAKWVS